MVDCEGLSAFTALRRNGIRAELMYFPTENHWVLKPEHSVAWHEKVFSWIKSLCS